MRGKEWVCEREVQQDKGKRSSHTLCPLNIRASCSPTHSHTHTFSRTLLHHSSLNKNFPFHISLQFSALGAMVSQGYNELFSTVVVLWQWERHRRLPRFLSYDTLLTVTFRHCAQRPGCTPDPHSCPYDIVSVGVWRPQRGYFLCSDIKVWHSASCSLQVVVVFQQADESFYLSFLKCPVSSSSYILYSMCPPFALMIAALELHKLHKFV